MTVKQLISQLKDYDGDMEVRIAQPTHDHWRNVKAADIDSIDELEIEHSDYHDGDVICNESAEGEMVLILQ